MIKYEDLKRVNEPFIDEIKSSIAEVVDSGWYILGESVQKFEEEFASYHSMEECIGVASGLDALVIGIQALDLPKGSEVLVPSNTYIATILAILKNDLKPVLVEPYVDTYNISIEEMRRSLTNQTSAVVVVHLYGKVCEMDKIMQFAREHDLRVVEDCAQAHGAMFDGQKAGTFGNIGAFSFYPTKNLGALGDAGAILCKSRELADKIRAIRNYGSKKKYYNEYVGQNSRLDEMQAAVLSVKLRHLDRVTKHKRKLAKIYLENLKNDFVLPVLEDRNFDVFHIFNIRHPQRDRFKKYLEKNEIMTEIHYPVAPIDQVAMKDIFDPKVKCPIALEIHKTTLSLPISFAHTESDVERVVGIANKF